MGSDEVRNSTTSCWEQDREQEELKMVEMLTATYLDGLHCEVCVWVVWFEEVY